MLVAVCRRLVSFAALLPLTAALLSGCGSSSNFGSTPASKSLGNALSGHVLGGQQPVSGAAISLYAAGTSSGAAATPLLRLPVFTDAFGNFTITSDYACPSASAQVYIVSRGGNPGLPGTVNNAAEVMMAPLGDCGNLTAGTQITINEITTAAGAWALAQFAPGSGSSNASFSASASNANGLRNAMLVANNLVNVATGAPEGVTLPAGAVMEDAKLNTLADVLSVCINSDGGSACTSLFTAATRNGTTPANTLDAALNIVRQPGINVAAVYNISSAQAPFQPTLTQAPNDWTMSVTYAGGGLYQPTTLGVDSAGNIWAANYYGGAAGDPANHVATKLSPIGVPFSATGYSDPHLYENYGLAVDTHDNVWISNEESPGVNSGQGSISKFASNGSLLSGNGITAGGVYFPYALAADSDGSIWIPDYGNSRLTILNNDGSARVPAPGYQPANFTFPINVAMDGNHNGWFATQSSAARVTAAGGASSYPCCTNAVGVALDPGGNVFIADYPNGALLQLSPTGTLVQTLKSGGLHTPENIAVDGAGQVWNVNYRVNTLSGFTAAGSGSITALSPATGFGVDARLALPYNLTIDASGGIWVSNFNANTVTDFVGLAAPRRTPLLGLPVAP